MGLFDRFRNKKDVVPKEIKPPKEDYLFEYNSEANQLILHYLRRLEMGEAPDPIFEQKSLSGDLNFNTLNLAELFLELSKQQDVSIERIAHFLEIGIPGGGDKIIGTLLRRVGGLAEAGFSESERIALLMSGVVGSRKEIAFLNPMFDNVGFVIKYAGIVKLVKDLRGHDAVDAEYDEVEDDPSWK